MELQSALSPLSQDNGLVEVAFRRNSDPENLCVALVSHQTQLEHLKNRSDLEVVFSIDESIVGTGPNLVQRALPPFLAGWATFWWPS